MRIFIWSLLLLFAVTATAQTDRGLVAYYSFDEGNANESRGNSSYNAFVNGNPVYECGVAGDAIRFDGLDDHLLIPGPINDLFNTQDFAISFYFKPKGILSTQTLISKRDDCSAEKAFSIRYEPVSRYLNVLLSQNPSASASVSEKVHDGFCWQHVVLSRENTKTQLYINGKEQRPAGASLRINVSNSAVLTVGLSTCIDTETNYEGLIDELRIYDRALDLDEVRGMFFAPDQIANRDTVLYLGNSFNASTTETCGSFFNWSPATGVSDVNIPNPVLAPTETTTYNLSIDDGECLAYDSVVVTVIDPASLDCSTLFLPNAFTPNGVGPIKNNSFGISNPFVIEQLLSFEIFDRWGNRVFYTENPQDRWYGDYAGTELNPGVFLYKVLYTCSGQELSEVGSLTLIR